MPVKRLLSVLLWLGCALLPGLSAPLNAEAPRPIVVSSIRPLHLIVLALAGDEVDAREFPGVGSEVHDFVLRPSAIRLLEDARLVLWIGPELERPLVELLAQFPGQRDVALLSALPPEALLRDADPHVWLDPRLGAGLARAIAAALGERAGLDEARLDARLDAFLERMQTVEQAMRTRLAGLEQVPFMVVHDGYGYYVRRFGLAQALALGPDAEHMPGARAVARMRAATIESGARCLLRESGSNERLVAMLTEGTGLRAREVDPLAIGADDYARFLEDFTGAVAACLRGSAS